MKLLFASAHDVVEGDLSTDQGRAVSSIVGRALRLIDLRMRYGKVVDSGERVLSIGLEGNSVQAPAIEDVRNEAIQRLDETIAHQREQAIAEIDKELRKAS